MGQWEMKTEISTKLLRMTLYEFENYRIQRNLQQPHQLAQKWV